MRRLFFAAAIALAVLITPAYPQERSLTSADVRIGLPRWESILRLQLSMLTTEAVAIHNPNHDEARVRQMRERVSLVRAQIDERILEIQRGIDTAAFNGDVSVFDGAQRAALDRTSALNALIETTRLGVIDGSLDADAGRGLWTNAVFVETSQTTADMIDANNLGRDLRSFTLLASRMASLDQRFRALNSSVLVSLFRGDAEPASDEAAAAADLVAEMRRTAAAFPNAVDPPDHLTPGQRSALNAIAAGHADDVAAFVAGWSSMNPDEPPEAPSFVLSVQQGLRDVAPPL